MVFTGDPRDVTAYLTAFAAQDVHLVTIRVTVRVAVRPAR